MIGTLALAVGAVTHQGQQPTFDVQVAVPSKAPWKAGQNRGTLYGVNRGNRIEAPNVSVDAQIVTDGVPFEVGTAPPAQTVYPTVPSAGLTAPQSVPANPTNVFAPPTLPPAQIWTWDSTQAPQFAQASGAYRERLQLQFGRTHGKEFGYYATPFLAPGSSIQQFQLRSVQPGQLPPGTFWYVAPGKNGQSPQWYELVPQGPKKGPMNAPPGTYWFLQPGEKGKGPQWFEFKLQSPAPHAFTFVRPDAKSRQFQFKLQGPQGNPFQAPEILKVVPDQAQPNVIEIQPGNAYKAPQILKVVPGESNGTSPKIIEIEPGQPYKVFPDVIRELPGQKAEGYVFVQSSPPANVRVDVQSAGGALFKTLTPHQKELQRKRGYLRFEDLSAKQQQMLTHPQGQFEIDYHDGKQDLIIKD